jgi:NADH dehydrogenase FAD-containing subunit
LTLFALIIYIWLYFLSIKDYTNLGKKVFDTAAFLEQLREGGIKNFEGIEMNLAVKVPADVVADFRKSVNEEAERQMVRPEVVIRTKTGVAEVDDEWERLLQEKEVPEFSR